MPEERHRPPILEEIAIAEKHGNFPPPQRLKHASYPRGSWFNHVETVRTPQVRDTVEDKPRRRASCHHRDLVSQCGKRLPHHIETAEVGSNQHHPIPPRECLIEYVLSRCQRLCCVHQHFLPMPRHGDQIEKVARARPKHMTRGGRHVLRSYACFGEVQEVVLDILPIGCGDPEQEIADAIAKPTTNAPRYQPTHPGEHLCDEDAQLIPQLTAFLTSEHRRAFRWRC